MREIVAFLAGLGGLIEIIVAIGGPAMAGVGMETRETAPPMPTGPLLLGVGIGAASIGAGALIAMGRRGWPWGVLMIVGAVLGAAIVGPETGWYTLAAVFTLLAGVLALPLGLWPRMAHRRRG